MEGENPHETSNWDGTGVFFSQTTPTGRKDKQKNSEKNSASLFVLKRTDVHVGL